MTPIKTLHCFGCAHSASGQDKPSGERPCCFCIRNRNRNYKVTTWYDGSKPIKVPMDCYHSVDMLTQIEQFVKQRKKK